jgi:hypothetical protein
LTIRFTHKHFDFAALLLFFLTLLGLAYLYFQLGGVDFRGYYAPALLVTRGGNPYDYAQLAPVLEEITGFAGNNPFFYPPYFLLIFFPLLLLPFEAARLVWLLLCAVLFSASFELVRSGLGWEIHGWRRWSVYWLALLLLAAICMRSEQATVLVLFGTALFLHAVRYRRAGLAGLGALLMTLKPQVSLLICLFTAIWLFVYYRRAFWWAGGWLVGLTTLTSLIMPGWWNFDRSNFGSGLFFTWDGAERLVGVRVNATLYDFLQYVVQAGPPLIYVLAGLVFLAGGIAAWAGLRKTGPGVPILALCGLILLNLLVTPYALQYDYVLLTPVLFWVIMQMPKLRPASRLAVGLLIAASFLTLLLQTWSYQGYWQLLAIFAAFAWVLVEKAAQVHAISAPKVIAG